MFGKTSLHQCLFLLVSQTFSVPTEHGAAFGHIYQEIIIKQPDKFLSTFYPSLQLRQEATHYESTSAQGFCLLGESFSSTLWDLLGSAFR